MPRTNALSIDVVSRKNISPREQSVVIIAERFANERRRATLVFHAHRKDKIISPYRRDCPVVSTTRGGVRAGASDPATHTVRRASQESDFARGCLRSARGAHRKGRSADACGRGCGCGAPVRGRPTIGAREGFSIASTSGLGTRGDGRDVAFGETRGRGGRPLGRPRVCGEFLARERAGGARVRDHARRA